MPWVVKTFFSVGVLNVTLNMFVLFLSYLAGSLATMGIRNLLLLNLHKHGTAPILSESGNLWIRLNQLATRVYYRQSPTRMLIIFLYSVVFLIFEVSAESGVDSSTKCNPRRIKTEGLCATPHNGDGGLTMNIASALYTQQIEWDVEALARVPIEQGFRKDIDGNEAFIEEFVDRSVPLVVDNCSVHSHRLLPQNSTTIEMYDSRGMWNLQVVSIQEQEHKAPLDGSGDVTGNQRYHNAFFITRPTGGMDGGPVEAVFYDYGDSMHNYRVTTAMYARPEPLRYRPMKFKNRGKILKYTLTCSNTSLTARDFETAIQVYRSTQLERKVGPHPAANVTVGQINDDGELHTDWVEVPRPLNASDVVKAVIALKMTDEEDCAGETLVYSTCGTYNVLRFLPVLFTVVVLAVIALLTTLRVRYLNADMPIPVTGQAWSRYAWLELCRQRNVEALRRHANGEGGSADLPPSEAQLLVTGEDVCNYMRPGAPDIVGDAEFALVTDEDGELQVSMKKRE